MTFQASSLLHRCRQWAALLSLSALTSLGHAAPVVDQSNLADPAPVGFCTLSWGAPGCTWYQTITAGMSGQLTGLILQGRGTADVKVGIGYGATVGSWVANVSGATVDGSTVIDLSPYSLMLSMGQTFVVSVYAYDQLLGHVDQPPGTALWAAPYGSAPFDYTTYSLGYETYMESAQVPEPASLALLGVALLGLGAVRRQRLR